MSIPDGAKYPDTWLTPATRIINPFAIVISRHALQWSQGRLARYVGVGRETISFWERGHYAPTKENQLILADWIESTRKLLQDGQLHPNATFYRLMEQERTKQEAS